MARLALALILAVGVLGTSTHGYEFQAAKRYVSRIIEKASNFVSKKDSTPYPTEDSRVAFVCREDGLFSNPSDCGTYIRCFNGVYYVLPCANQQHFNNVTRMCEEPCDAHCDRSIACECGWDSCRTNTETYPTEEPTDRFYRSQDSFTCSKDGVYPNPTDCTKYIRCSNGLSDVVSCSPGLHFSAEIEQCEAPCVAQCDPTIAEECKWDEITTPENDVCGRPPFQGPCEAMHTRYYFDRREGACKKFIFGGCRSNGNNFRTKQECSDKCLRRTGEKVSSMSQSASDSRCVREGVHRNPEDCGTYIQCSGGQRKVVPCPSALHFNEETERCENPCDAHCDPSLAEECEWEETITPENDFEVCRQPPHTGPCTDRIPRYYFDVNDGTCKKFIYGGCQSNGNNFKSERQCSIKCLRRSDTSVPKTKPDFDCMKDGLYRNPDDCATYIHCSNGRSYVMPCPKGLHFSEETERCERPCEAHCDESLAQECNWDETTTTPDDEFDVCRRPPFQGPCDAKQVRYYFDRRQRTCKKFIFGGCRSNGNNFRTEKECSDKCLRRTGYKSPKSIDTPHDSTCIRDGLYPNPEDCSSYIHCSNGNGHIMTCPENLHYSQETQRCESPCDAHCDPSMAEECNWDRKEYAIVKEDYTCIKDGLYPNKEDCATYIQCSNGQSYVMPCAKGLHFGEETQRCEIPCDAHCDESLAEECGWREEEEGHLLKQPVFDFSCVRNGLFENHADCGTFIQCTGGSAYLISCTYGLHFNPRTKKCESPCEAQCDPNIEEQCKEEDRSVRRFHKHPRRNSLKQAYHHEFVCTRDGQYPSSGDCTTYNRCHSGHNYVVKCPNGRHFSQETHSCEAPCDAHCDPSLAEICGWNVEVYAPRKPEYDFACGRDALLQNPEDCSTYIQCSESLAYIMPCPHGLQFSMETESCEKPCDAYCDSSLAEKCGWDRPVGSAMDHNYVNAASSTDPSRMLDDFRCVTDGLYRNPEDCTTYVQCSDGQAYVTPCLVGQHFSEETQKCETPCYAHCNQTLACSCDWPECNKQSSVDEIDCEVAPDAGSCFEEFPRYYYDSDSGRCRKFTYGGCGGNKNNFETERECKEKCQEKMLGGFRCPSKTGKFGHYPDCISYYECKRGIPTLKRCPAGTAFDHMKSKCVVEYEAKCVYECRDRDAVYPYEQDCHKYIDCINGVSKVEKCPSGTAFNPDERDCVDEERVSCPWH